MEVAELNYIPNACNPLYSFSPRPAPDVPEKGANTLVEGRWRLVIHYSSRLALTESIYVLNFNFFVVVILINPCNLFECLIGDQTKSELW